MSIEERIQRINKEIGGVASLFGITSWEKNFLSSIEKCRSLSDKQEKTLVKIENKVFGENK